MISWQVVANTCIPGQPQSWEKAGAGPGIPFGSQAVAELEAARRDAGRAERRALGRPRRQPPASHLQTPWSTASPDCSGSAASRAGA